MFPPHRIALGILVFTSAISFDSNATRNRTGSLRQPPPCQKNDISKPTHLWAREWAAKNLDALMDLYADDAVFLTATGSRTTGRAAIRELFRQALASGGGSQFNVCSRETGQTGGMAFDSGEYDETSASNGVKKSGKGNYLVVLRGDQKNRWRIVQHMWTDAGPRQQ